MFRDAEDVCIKKMEKIFFYREKKKGKAAKYSERERGSGIDAYMRAGRDAAMSTVPRHPPSQSFGRTFKRDPWAVHFLSTCIAVQASKKPAF